MELSLKNLEIGFKPNEKLELAKKVLLLSYVVLETLYKTIVGMYMAVEMDRLQCVVGAALATVLLIELVRLNNDDKILWIKNHSLVLVYFVIRCITFVAIGFQYTMLRSVFFEGIYLLILTELILDGRFCRNVIFKFFIAANVLLNIVNAYIYSYCESVSIAGTFMEDELFNYFTQYTYADAYTGMYYSSMYSNPNQMGLMTALAIILAINYISKDMSALKGFLAMIYFIFSLYCVEISNCSNAYVSLIAVACAYLVVKFVKYFTKKKLTVICLICCVLVTGVFYGIAAIHGEYDEYTTLEFKINDLSTERYAIWKDSYYSHQEEALLGCGNITLEKRDRYQYNLDKGIDRGFDINSSLIDYVGPHNGYIGMISCTGILGFIAFLGLLIKRILNSRSLDKPYWYLAIIFILVINLFECMMPVSKNFITLYMFLILAMDDRETLGKLALDDEDSDGESLTEEALQ